MKNVLLRWLVLAFGVGALTVLLASCILPGGPGYDDGGGYGAAYYEPYGVDYGGWGPGYNVAPFRGGGHRPTGGGGHASHAFRSAPASRSVPSLPAHSGGRGGGGERR
jgi:hypothetical protein